MFHFFRNQGKAVKILLSGLLFMVALSMLLYLVPDYNAGANSTNPVLLQVGSRKITAQEAQTGYQNYTRGRIPADLMKVYFPQYVNEMMMRMAAVEEARKMGLTASDEEVLEVLTTSPAFKDYFQDGKLVRRAEFEQVLAQQGVNIQTLMEDIRDQIILTKLQDAIAESTVVTPQEIEDEYRRKYERASIEYVALNEADLRSKVSVTDEEVRKRFEETKNQYNQPEKFSFRVVVLSQDAVASRLTITEQELRNEYAASIDNYRSPEQVHARHILLATDGKSDADKRAIRARAEELVKQARAGADFAELARKYSEDAGNAPNGGDLGTFGRGQMVPEFERAAFAMKDGEISDVVTTQFGYHIIKVEKKIPSVVTPFEAVRAELERGLRESKLAEAMRQTSEQLRAELLKNPAGAADIAQRFGAQLITVTQSAAGQPIPTLGVTPEIDNQLPGLQPGGVTPVVTLPGDRAAVAILDQRIPGRPSTFDEAKAAVRDALISEKTRLLVETRGKEIAERLRRGEDLRAVARSLDLTVETATDFGIVDSIPGLGPAVYLRQAFTAGVGAVIGPQNIAGRTVVAKVTAKKEADLSGLEVERKDLLLQLKAARARINNNLWMDGIVERMKASGEVKVFEDELARVLAQMR
jgi:peptidyl-prolyl cis-trans isomerase D